MSDSNGVSSKRLVSLLGFVSLSVAFYVSIWKEVKIKEFIWDGMMIIVLGGLGMSVVDKYVSIRKKASNGTPIAPPEPPTAHVQPPAPSEPKTPPNPEEMMDSDSRPT